MKKSNIEMLLNRLRDLDWTEVANCNGVNTAHSTFHCIFTKIFNICCPNIRTNANCKSNHKPWLTQGLVNARKKKNNLNKVCLNCGSKEAEMKYKVYKNKLITILRFSEKQYYGSKLVEYVNNLKRTWQLLNEITMRKIKSYKWPNEFYCSEHTYGVG